MQGKCPEGRVFGRVEGQDGKVKVAEVAVLGAHCRVGCGLSHCMPGSWRSSTGTLRAVALRHCRASLVSVTHVT